MTKLTTWQKARKKVEKKEKELKLLKQKKSKAWKELGGTKGFQLAYVKIAQKKRKK